MGREVLEEEEEEEEGLTGKGGLGELFGQLGLTFAVLSESVRCHPLTTLLSTSSNIQASGGSEPLSISTRTRSKLTTTSSELTHYSVFIYNTCGYLLT